MADNQPSSIDWKAIRKALEDGAKVKKDYEDLLLKKGFSESMVKVVTDNLATVMEPVLKEMAQATNDSNKALLKGITDAFKGDDTEDSAGIVKAIADGFKGIQLKPQVTVNTPKLEVPIPQAHFTMPAQIKAVLEYNAKNPLPVILMGPDGKPFVFSNLPGNGGGQTAGGGRGDFFTLSYTNASPLPVTLVSGAGATSAVNISDSSGVGYSGSNPLPVTLISGSISSTRAQIGNSDGDFSVANPLPITGPVIVTSITNTTTTRLDTPDGIISGANPMPVTVVSSSASTTSVRLDTPDGLVSAANPIPVTLISGALTSTIAVGAVVAGAADDGSAPLKVGGITRTTNPGPMTDGQRVSASYDTLGRQVMRQHQVRGLIKTAYVTLSTGTEATLLSGVAGAFLDLLYVMGANTSSAAVQVDIRAVTAGNIVATLYIPANSTAGVTLPLGWPQSDTGNNWTVDMGDITNSNVLISALFSQEV